MDYSLTIRTSLTTGIVTLVLCLIFSQPLLATGGMENTIISENIEKLDQQFKILSLSIYQHHSQSDQGRLRRLNNIDNLQQWVRLSVEEQHYMEAISQIVLNLATIKNNINHESVIYFVELLLEHNEWNTASSLFLYAESVAEGHIVSRLHFVFAKYHFERKEWTQSKQRLQLANADSMLPKHEADYAMIINGVLLQYNKNHRAAIKYYKNVPQDSQYYAYAQLNNAVVNIRQGWWTDGHLIIKQLLNDEDTHSTEDIVNRLYVVLGYSLLQNEFYRSARDAFRNVHVKSPYVNQALLGISLSAANQGDNIGALNGLTTLNAKNTFDIYVDESYVLLPVIHERLDQGLAASVSYHEAVEYYQKRITKLKKTLKLDNSNNFKKHLKHNKPLIIIENQAFDLTKQYPQSFIKNLLSLERFKSHITDTSLKRDISILSNKYDKTFSDIVTVTVEEHIKYLNSYLNQSRYGLAQLYDNK